MYLLQCNYLTIFGSRNSATDLPDHKVVASNFTASGIYGFSVVFLNYITPLVFSITLGDRTQNVELPTRKNNTLELTFTTNRIQMRTAIKMV